MKMWPKGWRSLTLNFCWERDLAFTDSVFSVTLWAISTTNSENLLYVYVNSQKWMLVYTVYTLLYSLIFSPHNLFQKPCCAYLLSFFQRMQSSLGQLYHHWFNSLLMTVFMLFLYFFVRKQCFKEHSYVSIFANYTDIRMKKTLVSVTNTQELQLSFTAIKIFTRLLLLHGVRIWPVSLMWPSRVYYAEEVLQTSHSVWFLW